MTGGQTAGWVPEVFRTIAIRIEQTAHRGSQARASIPLAFASPERRSRGHPSPSHAAAHPVRYVAGGTTRACCDRSSLTATTPRPAPLSSYVWESSRLRLLPKPCRFQCTLVQRKLCPSTSIQKLFGAILCRQLTSALQFARSTRSAYQTPGALRSLSFAGCFPMPKSPHRFASPVKPGRFVSSMALSFFREDCGSAGNECLYENKDKHQNANENLRPPFPESRNIGR